MKSTLLAAGLLAAAVSGPAFAAATMAAPPSEGMSVTNYYKQSVYDPKETKIGEVDDVLLDRNGRISGLVLGVGGFLGVGEKNVIVPFEAVKMEKKNDKTWLAVDETKDSLKSAPGFAYDRATTTWKPAK
ncbi:MAG TPA: PRC-barrel domain-containing protein [Rhodoblastus sp.]|nr:PRC-barrel domain-containing protein [Rhodoblastus sp.]